MDVSRYTMLCQKGNLDKWLKSSVTRLGKLMDFGQLYKPLATINWSKSPTFLGIFCRGGKILNFTSEIIFGQLLSTFGDFFWSHCLPL